MNEQKKCMMIREGELESEHLHKAVVAELERIRDNLRAKGDHHRADRVEKFKQEYFGEPTLR